MPEQKRGPRRAADASDEVERLINASHCYHHFVSSWMAHDKGKHETTDGERRQRSRDPHGAREGGASETGAPVGQGIRTTNPWRSYELQKRASDAPRDGRMNRSGSKRGRRRSPPAR